MKSDWSNGKSPAPIEQEESDDSPENYLDEFAAPASRKLQILSVGSLQLGVFEDEIATIAEWRPPTPLPHAPSAVLGVVSIQGRILTVLDPSLLLGHTVNHDEPAWRHIVALRGDEQLALAIEDLTEILALQAADLTLPADDASRAVLGVLNRGDQLITVIDTRALFPTAILGRERRQRRF